MKVIITGATGMVGKGVLLECLDHENIVEILSIGRRSLKMEHSKLKEIIHEDFSYFGSVADQLMGYDACYHCMGVSAAGLSEGQYTKMTYEFTMALATTLINLNKEMTFIYVSGQGTDATEKGRSKWARIKGKTENDLLSIGFKQAFMWRPGAIIPLRGIQPSSKLYRVLITYLKWLIYIIKWINPDAVVNTTQIGMAMINATKSGYHSKVVIPRDIIRLAQQ